jgi:hypothetical protein
MKTVTADLKRIGPFFFSDKLIGFNASRADQARSHQFQ